MTPADVERLALICGASPTQAYALATHHEHADVRPWLTPLLAANVRTLRDLFLDERACPACESPDTRTVRADVNTGGKYLRQCNACARLWEIRS